MPRVKNAFSVDRWNIGTSQVTFGRVLAEKSLGPVTWWQEGGEDYAADPFFWPPADGIIYEDLRLGIGRGRLFSSDHLGTSPRELVQVRDVEHLHLSFPSTIQVDGATYVVPECWESGRLAIWRWDPLQGALVPYSTVANQIRATDPAIFLHDNLWWVVTSEYPNDAHLRIFCASEMEGPWAEATGSPQEVESDMVRNAGNFIAWEGDLYRVTQDGARRYGHRVVVSLVTQCNSHGLQFERLFNLEPQSPYSEGLHTFNLTPYGIVVDGCRRKSSPLVPLRKLRNRSKVKARHQALGLEL